ncbi:MAG TPA: Mrp/NBP35 family ATP-binding protein [Gemmatimonadota bacterium]|nr:Mrp/NBP35 family ATP-binding protein [Gemmatimonadota bacterium]
MADERSLPERVAQALRAVPLGDDGGDVVSGGRVRDLEVATDGSVRLGLRLRAGDSPQLPDRVRRAASAVDGVRGVEVKVAGPGAGDAGGPSGGPPRPSGRSLPIMGQGGGGHGGGHGESSPGGGRGPHGAPPGSRPADQDRAAASRHPREAPALESVRHVVAVSSGKGGVGKSTVATNLAAAWASMGHSVGLLDADVYGPDIPTMFGVHDRPRMADEEVIPLEAHGVKLMSIGFLVDEDTPAIWRGPIIMGIVRQFLQQVRWGELDYLIVDLPPGTGDAQLSLVQLVQVRGGVFVTTPQDVAVGGVLKGIKMFEKLEIPILGLVENMSGFVCPDCGARHDVFGSGGGEKLAATIDVPFLGAVPLGVAVREEGDRGLPTVLGRPDSPEAKALRSVAEAVAGRAETLAREAEGS